MKIVTILGTRPEIIRLSLIIPKLNKFFKNFVIHTGQNYDYELDKIFFKELGLKKPDFFLNARGIFAEQLSKISIGLNRILDQIKPDRFLVLGDTNSSLGAIIAKRKGIPVFHMEAGNRQYLDKVPEEINRKIIDTCSDILLPYTNRSCHNLIVEGFKREKIFVTGNPIFEVLKFYNNKIENSQIIKKLKIEKQNYILCTFHREENVDNFNILTSIFKSLNQIAKKYKVIFPIHPRTNKNLKKVKLKLNKNIFLLKPLGYFDFINLMKSSKCIITDSGTVQEESAILNKPNIIARLRTERPETVESGSSIISGVYAPDIIQSFKNTENLNETPSIIKEYYETNVSMKIVKILSSKYDFDK